MVLVVVGLPIPCSPF